jgi:hypothetical protein
MTVSQIFSAMPGKRRAQLSRLEVLLQRLQPAEQCSAASILRYRGTAAAARLKYVRNEPGSIMPQIFAAMAGKH